MYRFLLFFSLVFLFSCKKQEESIRYQQPAAIRVVDVMVGDRNGFDGKIHIRKITNPGADIVINSGGEQVWTMRANTSMFRPFTPKEDRYLSLFNDTKLYDITYSGDTLFSASYGAGGFDRKLHHDLIYDGDHIAALTKEKIFLDLSGTGGTISDSIVTDGILVLDRKGNKIWSWKLNDVLDPLKYPNISKSKKDWGHANSLAVDTDGHYLLSWRDFNEVWKVDSSTGGVIWKYGHDLARDSSEMFYGQHSFHSIGNGNYLLFDNGDRKIRPSSRALGFRYDRETGFTQNLSIYLPDSLFTSKQGSVYKISDDKYLFSSSKSSALVITDGKGDILWYAKGTEPYYRAYYLDDHQF